MERLRNAWNTGSGATRFVAVTVGLVLLACVGLCGGSAAVGTLQGVGALLTTATLVDTATIPPPTVVDETPSATLTTTPLPSHTPTLEPSPSPTLAPTASTTSIPTLEPTPTPLPTDTPEPVPPASVGDVIEIHFIDVEQGDAILVRGGGSSVLVDGGEQGTGVVRYLRTVGVERLDAVVATHPHADHIGGLIDVLRAMPVDVVITNGQPHTTRTYERFLDAIIAAQAEYREVSRGEQIQAGGLTFHVLHPVYASGSNLNEQSVVLRLDHGQVSILLTGDIESKSESNLVVSTQRLQAQILKVPHHASSSSNSRGFLQAVKPEVAIYFAGADNNYGHPHAETLRALQAVAADIYGTDVNGTVVVTTDGVTYQVRASRSGPIAAPVATAVPAPTATKAPVATAVPAATAVPVATAVPTVAAPVGARVVIVKVDKVAEFVDIRNTGDTAQDLGGWVLVSEKGNQRCGLGGVLEAGQTLRIWAMAADAGQGGYNCGFGTNIWNNSEPDPAALYDAAGNLVDRR